MGVADYHNITNIGTNVVLMLLRLSKFISKLKEMPYHLFYLDLRIEGLNLVNCVEKIQASNTNLKLIWWQEILLGDQQSPLDKLFKNTHQSNERETTLKMTIFLIC